MVESAIAGPQTAVAALFHVRPETINRHLRQTRELLHQAQHTIQPSPDHLATIEDLHTYATTHGITTPKIKSEC